MQYNWSNIIKHYGDVGLVNADITELRNSQSFDHVLLPSCALHPHGVSKRNALVLKHFSFQIKKRDSCMKRHRVHDMPCVWALPLLSFFTLLSFRLNISAETCSKDISCSRVEEHGGAQAPLLSPLGLNSWLSLKSSHGNPITHL